MRLEDKTQPPSESGLYWVKTGSYRWYNAIAYIEGKAPYLHLSSVYFPHDACVRPVLMSDIGAWGERIAEPEAR